jgi:hypothetical protein
MVDSRDELAYKNMSDDTNTSKATGCDVKWFNAEE